MTVNTTVHREFQGYLPVLRPIQIQTNRELHGFYMIPELIQKNTAL